MYIYDKMIKKNNISNLFGIFLILHLAIWTIIPSISNLNLPLDTIEALAWGSNLDWGFAKHPPLSAFIIEIFFQVFGNQDWVYYFLSQFFILITFFVVWKFSEEFIKDSRLSLTSVLLIEGIYFYNFTTPEFNVNICQLPFWALTTFYFWKSINEKKIKNWILFGIFASLGFLSKYLFFYLLVSIGLFFSYYTYKEKKIDYKIIISILIFLTILSPHLFWLYENNYSTITYALKRTGADSKQIIDHLIYPSIFLFKQIVILIPFIAMCSIIVKRFKIKINLKDKKLLFLIFVNLVPIFLIFLTSLVLGGKIRTMWMTPFYIFFGILIIYIYEAKINFMNIKKFLFLFLFLFLLSPSLYLYISLKNKTKRTDFPGKEIAYLVQSKWEKNFTNEIEIIVGDEWFGGNLSYHLNSRPTWYKSLTNVKKENIKGGVVYAGNPVVLKKICPGVFGTIKPIGICMIGSK